VAVSAPVSGLSVHGTYHFRVSAKNSSGTSKGSDQTFTTLPPVTSRQGIMRFASIQISRKFRTTRKPTGPDFSG